MNLTILKGNLTRDIELKYTPSGAAVAELSLAVNEVWYNDAKEKQERVHFFDCVAWGKQGENIAKYFGKGMPILIEGSLSQETWDDKQSGQKRSKVRVKVSGFDFCGGEKKVSGEPVTRPAAKREAKPDPDLDAVSDDQIPY